MKLTPILALTLLALAACEKKLTVSTAPAPTPEPIAPATPAPTATPAPVPKIAEATPAPATPAPASHLAPEGVFFLTVAKSIMTDDGIIGLPPGTKVLRQAEGAYLAGEHKLTLRADEVTNDLRMAQQLAQAARSVPVAAAAPVAPVAAAAAIAVPPAATPRVVYVPRARSTPAPTPANALERAAFSKKKAFRDTDGDGRAFDTNQRPRSR